MSIAKYSHQRINQLKQILLNNAENGKPMDYEIHVDDMKVVPRTNDPEQFDNYEEFVTEETRKIVVLFYDGNSRRNTRHILLLKEDEPKPQQNTLSGVEIEKMVSEKLELEKKQWKQELMEKENKELKEKIEEAEEFIQKQGKIIQDLKSDRKLGDMQWGELIGIAGESILRRNTKLLAKVPGMSALAGVIEADNKNQQKQVETPKPQVEAEASFKKVKEEEQENPPKENSGLSKEDKDRLDFLKQLQERFSEEELKQLLTLLNVLVQKPETIEPAILFAAQWKEKSAKTETEPIAVKPEIKNEKPLQQATTEEEKITEKQEEEKPEEKKEEELNKGSEVATDGSTVDSEIGNFY